MRRDIEAFEDGLVAATNRQQKVAMQGKLTNSTGSLTASAAQEAQHHHRLSYDADSLNFVPRANSVTQELPPQDWLIDRGKATLVT